MKRIYLIRHCKAVGQDPEAELTEVGQKQAEELATLFTGKQIDYIISSPYKRAIASVIPLAAQHDLEIQLDDRLCERVLSTGELNDWMERLKESFEDLDMKLPGGESSREAMKRGVSIIEELLESPYQNIVIVTHGNLKTLILKYFDKSFGFNEWKGLTNPDIYEVVKAPEGIISVNRIWK